MEGLVLSGGDGIPGNWCVTIKSIGVLVPDSGSFVSATDGDCSGDCILNWALDETSVIRGGSSGVPASPSSNSDVLLLAFSISRKDVVELLSRLPKMLLVGVGGKWRSEVLSRGLRPEFDLDDDLLEGAFEVA